MSDMSTNTKPIFEYVAHAGEGPKDGLFLERLDTFMEKCLGDIKAFADRELRPYEETRRCIAQWHAKYLFQSSTDTSTLNRSAQVRATLRDTSRILESLSEVSGVQSFLLAVDPNDASDGGFLGGSLIGREFWRVGMRGGGETGARAFKAFYATHAQTTAKASASRIQTTQRHVSTPPPKVKGPEGPAKSLKNELYETVRNALRTTSGINNAEMKWTNPEKLDVYGVRLIGWPEGVPAQNPSTLKVSQNKVLYEAIQSGTMRFEKLAGPQLSRAGDDETRGNDDADANDDFSWAYDVDPRPPSPPPERLPVASSFPLHRQVMNAETLPHDKSEPEQDVWTLDPTAELDATLSTYDVDYSWGDEFSEGMMDTLGEEWGSEAQTQSERPRKRPRSEEPSSGADHHVSK